MPKPLQLHIPKPCHEDWAGMHPSGNGRHCMACQKTVVDFTAMSDAEILQYMREAGSQVCGRLTPGQMNRDLMPSPVQRNGGKGWPWLIAGALMTADGAPPDRMGVKGKMQLQTPVKPIIEDDISGVMIIEPGADLVTSELPDSPVVKIKRFITDTLTMLRIIPKMELNVYPNPIPRGTSFHIAWPSEPGTYKVSLISADGVLVQTRLVEVGSSSQVDTWEMPGGAAAGVYLIQAMRPGQTLAWTQKVIVE